MFSQKSDPGLMKKIHDMLNENPSVMPIHLADACGISEAQAVYALPQAMRCFADAQYFDDIWHAMTGWEKITFISSKPTAIIEFRGTLPPGKHAHGFFNLMGKNHSLGGHLRVSELGAICFLDKLLFGLRSLSVQFYDKQGAQMFAVYVGRHEGKLIDSVSAAFMDLRNTYFEKELS